MHRDVRILQMAEKQSGAFSMSQARAAGFDRSAISRRVQRGTWRAVLPGVYRAAGAAPTWSQACTAATLWGGTGSAVAGLSAARLWNLDLPAKVLASSVVQVDVPNRWWRGEGHPNVEVFRRLNLTEADVTVREGVPCTTLQRTLLDIAGLLSPIALEVALDSARRREPRIVGWVSRLLARLGTQGRKGAGVLRRLIAERRDLRQDSAIEVRLLRPLLEAGEKPLCNVPIRHHGQHVATVDLLLPRGNLVVFTHGFAFHSDKPQWERDILQVRQLQRLGYRVLCFSASDVRNDLKGCLADIFDALAGNTARRNAP